MASLGDDMFFYRLKEFSPFFNTRLFFVFLLLFSAQAVSGINRYDFLTYSNGSTVVSGGSSLKMVINQRYTDSYDVRGYSCSGAGTGAHKAYSGSLVPKEISLIDVVTHKQYKLSVRVSSPSVYAETNDYYITARYDVTTPPVWGATTQCGVDYHTTGSTNFVSYDVVLTGIPSGSYVMKIPDTVFRYMTMIGDDSSNINLLVTFMTKTYSQTKFIEIPVTVTAQVPICSTSHSDINFGSLSLNDAEGRMKSTNLKIMCSGGSTSANYVAKLVNDDIKAGAADVILTIDGKKEVSGVLLNSDSTHLINAELHKTKAGTIDGAAVVEITYK